MKTQIETTVNFGKVDYTDTEITNAQSLLHFDVPEKDVLHQTTAVMNPLYDDAAWVIVDLTDFYRGENERLLETGTFAVIELEEDSDGGISWDGSFVCGPTSREAALACAIDRARYA